MKNISGNHFLGPFYVKLSVRCPNCSVRIAWTEQFGQHIPAKKNYFCSVFRGAIEKQKKKSFMFGFFFVVRGWGKTWRV